MYSYRIRKVTVSNGIITTIAGTGMASATSDSGAATSISLNGPRGVATDSSGRVPFDPLLISFAYLRFISVVDNVYIADTGNHRIRKVTVSTGMMSTIAGSGSSSYNGDNYAATSASMYYPQGVALDSSGSHSISLLKLA